MNLKIIALTGTLVLGSAVASQSAPYVQPSAVAVNSQKEFDKAFAVGTDAKTLNLAGHAYDNQSSRLFWFTDLEAAKKQAKAEGKPILSLRLLGKLSDEYSCANSRFFRVLLYPNAQINPILRDKFVLHWSSERPVPVVTIDFGDGRKIKQTLTGNSAHYLLDETGRPLDVLPGLYSPDAFEAWLTEGEKLAANWKAESGETREQTLRKWHEARISAIWSEQAGAGSNTKWVEAQTANSLKENPFVTSKPDPNGNPYPVVPARVAAAASPGAKRRAEAPVLNSTNLFSGSPRLQDWLWGNPIKGDVKLDEATKARIKAMNPRLDESAVPLDNDLRLAAYALFPETKEQSASVPKPDPFNVMVQKLEQSVSIDTAFNKFRMEIPIHALFAKGEQGSFESLNRKIYDTLFLTPKGDHYLGLGSDGIFTALQNAGIIENTSP